MRLSRTHIDYIAFLVYKSLKDHAHIKLLDGDKAVGIVRHEIQENLRLEEELEKEALDILQKHRSNILQQGADFQKVLRDGVKALAKKRGVVV